MNLARRVTIRDVAARAEVSIATVSKVMNGRYGVASDTIERVERAIADLGYEASLAAQSLRNRRTNVIGVLVADFEPFSTEVLKGAADAIRGTGFELVVYSSGGRVGEHVGREVSDPADDHREHVSQCNPGDHQHPRPPGDWPSPDADDDHGDRDEQLDERESTLVALPLPDRPRHPVHAHNRSKTGATSRCLSYL